MNSKLMLPFKKNITILTAPGVGDIFWVYQKLSPHFNKINIIISILESEHTTPQDTRSLPFVKTLPKINDVSFRKIKLDQWNEVMYCRKTLNDLLKKYKDGDIYAINKWLEDGCRIDEIDNFKIEETVDILCEPIEIPNHEYIVLYISDSPTANVTWEPNKYAHLIKNTYEKYNVNYPIVLLGATYDQNNLIAAGDELKKFGYSVHTAINPKFTNTNYIIKNSSYFIGYQSGLCIIADNFDIPQTMIYFNNLGKLMYSWPKKRNIKNNIYNATQFKDNINYCKNFELLKPSSSN
jgi:ADP-heptose:LPS heptosyltransferase